MDELKLLFDYQRFAQNPRLQRQLDSVARRYLSRGEALEDDELDVAAAGEPWTQAAKEPPGQERRIW